MKNVKKGWVVCLIAACFFCYELVQFHMLNAISPLLMRDFCLNATDFSALCSTYLLADVIFLIPAGMILDRVSVRKVILVALALCVIGTFGFAVSTTLLQACVAHFLSGIGNAFCFLSCMMLANSWFGHKSSFVMSVMITIGLLGGVLAQVPFTDLAASVGWQNTLVIDGIVGCCIWVVSYFFIQEKEQHRSAKNSPIGRFFSEMKPAFLNGQVWKCGFYTGFLNLPLMIISAMIGNLFLTQQLHFDLREASGITSMISLGTILGSPLYGFVSDFFRRKKLWMIAGAVLSLMTFFMIMNVTNPSFFTMILLFFALGFFSSSQVLGYPMITDSAPKDHKGTAMGVAALIIMGLAFIGQPLTGFLIDKASAGGEYNFSYALLIFPVGFLIALVLSLWLKEEAHVEVMQ